VQVLARGSLESREMMSLMSVMSLMSRWPSRFIESAVLATVSERNARCKSDAMRFSGLFTTRNGARVLHIAKPCHVVPSRAMPCDWRRYSCPSRYASVRIDDLTI
jgi:hypothetical protein